MSAWLCPPRVWFLNGNHTIFAELSHDDHGVFGGEWVLNGNRTMIAEYSGGEHDGPYQNLFIERLESAFACLLESDSILVVLDTG